LHNSNRSFPSFPDAFFLFVYRSSTIANKEDMMVRSFQGKPVPLRTASTATGTVRVYDPAMCCSTGLCGPSVDSHLLQVARDLRRFEAEGVKVERFNLSQQPSAFVEDKRVAGLLQACGEEVLPVTLVNDTILVSGRYASREEILAALAKEPTPVSSQAQKSGTCGCEPDSGCC
jgi:Arsenical resistance operon protein ArsD